MMPGWKKVETCIDVRSTFGIRRQNEWASIICPAVRTFLFIFRTSPLIFQHSSPKSNFPSIFKYSNIKCITPWRDKNRIAKEWQNRDQKKRTIAFQQKLNECRTRVYSEEGSTTEILEYRYAKNMRERTAEEHATSSSRRKRSKGYEIRMGGKEWYSFIACLYHGHSSSHLVQLQAVWWHCVPPRDPC